MPGGTASITRTRSASEEEINRNPFPRSRFGLVFVLHVVGLIVSVTPLMPIRSCLSQERFDYPADNGRIMLSRCAAAKGACLFTQPRNFHDNKGNNKNPQFFRPGAKNPEIPPRKRKIARESTSKEGAANVSGL